MFRLASFVAGYAVASLALVVACDTEHDSRRKLSAAGGILACGTLARTAKIFDKIQLTH